MSGNIKLKFVEGTDDIPHGIYLVRYNPSAEWELHKWDGDWYYTNMGIKKLVGCPMEPDFIYGPLPERVK